MDPLSITLFVVSCGATAYKVSTSLSKFKDGVKNVDRSVDDLQSEVIALGKSLENIKMILGSQTVLLAEKHADPKEKQELWSSVQDSLSDCKSTLDRLQESLVPVATSGGTSFGRQTAKHIKLNMKQDEINNIRTQIRGHTSTLQLMLQVINVRATSLVPGAIVEELGPKIDQLRLLLEARQKDTPGRNPSSAFMHVEKLRASALRVLSTASMASGSSEAAKSIVGESMDEEGRRKTLSWIQNSHRQNSTTPEWPSISETGRDPFDFSEAGRVLTAGTDSSYTDIIDDSDSDKDVDAEVADALFSKGSKLFKSEQYAEAEGTLKKGLTRAQRLSTKRKESFQLADVKFMLATCSYQLSDLDAAESRLFAITQVPASSVQDQTVLDREALRRYEASHLLAAVLVRKDRFEAARPFCQRAVNGRRRLLGKQHILYYESLYLGYQIYEALGSSDEASIYFDWIPSEVRETLVKVKDQFPAEEDVAQAVLDETTSLEPRPSSGILTGTKLSPSLVLANSADQSPPPLYSDQSSYGTETTVSPVIAGADRRHSMTAKLSSSPDKGSPGRRRTLWSRLSPAHALSQPNSTAQKPLATCDELQLPESATQKQQIGSVNEENRRPSAPAALPSNIDGLLNDEAHSSFVNWARRREKEEKGEVVSWPGLF